jgi:catechol 2,3-dioxygenase-like lactoylglutathione lyase family enzyme
MANIDLKLEIIVIPVSDVDRTKEFYAQLGWRLDADFNSGNDFRVIQLTPPASGCSIIFGENVAAAPPGSAPSLFDDPGLCPGPVPDRLRDSGRPCRAAR